MTAAFETQPAAPAGRRVRVMIVDDAAVVRRLVARWIEAEPDFELAAAACTGREAVEQFDRVNPDVVILDVAMPDLDGVSALPLLLKKKRDVVVIMVSTLTRRNAEISIKALALGAADCIPKPSNDHEAVGSVAFRRELVDKVRQLGLRSLRRSSSLAERARLRFAKLRTKNTAPLKLRPFGLATPRVLTIGSSTGGPQALMALVTQLGPVLDRAPILITQHMPPTFTTILAEHLARVAGRPAHEAIHDEEIRAGTIYVAPGGKHMRVARVNGNAVIKIDDGEPVNFCKPAVDPLFATAAEVWGPHVLGVVLTGMGSDGAMGAKAIAQAGGSVIAQDEASSVVWGMPAQAAATGACSAVMPLLDIAPRVARLFEGHRT